MYRKPYNPPTFARRQREPRPAVRRTGTRNGILRAAYRELI